MITFKKFAMAVMLIAGFQQASADVCKLKVKKEIVEALNKYDDLGEVWVNKENGGIYEGSYKGGVHIISVNKISTAFNCDGELKEEYKDAIFCNDKGEVVILNGLASKYKLLLKDKNNNDRKEKEKHRNNKRGKQYEPNNRVNISFVKQTLLNSEKYLIDKISKEAKQQFENIIKCGLIVPVRQCKANGDLLDEKNKQGTFNPRIFDTPFTVLRGGNWVCNEKWRMPAISADLSESTLKNVPVMCAMKRDIETEIDIHKTNVKNYIDNNKLLINKDSVSNDIKDLQDNAELSDKLLILKNIQNNISSMNIQRIKDTITRQEREQRQKEMYECLITKGKWTSIFKHECDFNIYATEHTERQLLAYHCLNNPPVEWLTDASDRKCFNVTPYEVVEQNNYNSSDSKHLLIYTHGAPCFDEGNNCKDNGGMCCWNLYRHCVPHNINVDVYFSQFLYNELLDNDRRKNILGEMFALYGLLGENVECCDKELRKLYKAIFKLDYKRDETLLRELIRSKLKLENDCGKSYERFEEYLKASDWKNKPNIQIHLVNHGC